MSGCKDSGFLCCSVHKKTVISDIINQYIVAKGMLRVSNKTKHNPALFQYQNN